jgi:hypothetical protein
MECLRSSCAIKSLIRILPGQHAIFRYSLVKDLITLLLAIRDKKDVVAGAARNRNGALYAPGPGLRDECRRGSEDVVDLLAVVLFVER